MTRDDRRVRRAAGMLAVGLAGAGLDRIEDERSSRNRRWAPVIVFTTILLGMLTGQRSFKDTERLTTTMSSALRRKVGIRRRVPDTTQRDQVMSAKPGSVRFALHRQVRTALRRKQLEPVGLPCGVLTLDGKVVMTMLDDSAYAQPHGDGRFCVRTMTCALVSGRATVCIDVSPIPREHNEMAWFVPTLAGVIEAYGRSEMFQLITTDAGMVSKENADFVHDDLHLGYLFALKENQPTLVAEVDRFLGRLPAKSGCAETREKIGGRTHVRRLWLTEEVAGSHGWTHLSTGLRVQYTVQEKDGTVVSTMDRLFISNEKLKRFTPEQWLAIVRAHWRVENDVHKTLDVAMAEDDRPWSRDPRAMLTLQVLRRIACNALTLFRSVSLRSDGKKAMPWRDLFDWLMQAVHAALPVHVDGLRWESPGASVART